jgi:hypothetical protein
MDDLDLPAWRFHLGDLDDHDLATVLAALLTMTADQEEGGAALEVLDGLVALSHEVEAEIAGRPRQP